MVASHEEAEAQGNDTISDKYSAVLLNDLEEIDRECDMERDPGMMELRKGPLLNAEEWRFSDGSHIELVNWINMAREQGMALLRNEMKIEHVLSQWRPLHLDGTGARKGGPNSEEGIWGREVSTMSKSQQPSQKELVEMVSISTIHS